MLGLHVIFFIMRPSPFSFLLFCLLKAIARAMEEWERRKEEGALGSEQEQEEENIYAVSKDQEV